MTFATQYEAEAPTTEPASKFKRLQTDVSTASTDFPEYDDLSELDDSDDDLGAETEVMMKAVRQSNVFFNDASTEQVENDDDFEAEIEAEILEATTRKITPVFSIEEQMSFAPPLEVCTVSSKETDDREVECGVDFW